MKAIEGKQKLDEALNELARQLEQGLSGAMREYLSVASRFHRYSFGNQVLLWAQMPEATRVAGFHTWKKLGRSVKKGEHGLMILAPRSGSRTITVTDEAGNASKEERKTTYFAPAYVFDVSQTEGEDLPEPAKVSGEPGDLLSRLEAFVTRDLEIALETSDRLGAALGDSSNGRIRLKAGLAPAERFSVLVHETAHELLHWSLPQKDRDDKTLIETQAEAVAFTVCHAVGLETGTAAADYIQLYRGNRETLRQSLAAIQKAAGRILDALEKAPAKAPAKEEALV